jgi:hypothetical protein
VDLLIDFLQLVIDGAVVANGLHEVTLINAHSVYDTFPPLKKKDPF